MGLWQNSWSNVALYVQSLCLKNDKYIITCPSECLSAAIDYCGNWLSKCSGGISTAIADPHNLSVSP